MPKREIDTSAMFKSMTGKKGNAVGTAENNTAHGTKKRKNGKSRAEQQTVKLGFYLTPNTYTAMRLYKATRGIGSHKDSKIINDALTKYLDKELAVLSEISGDLSDDERFSEALKRLISG